MPHVGFSVSVYILNFVTAQKINFLYLWVCLLNSLQSFSDLHNDTGSVCTWYNVAFVFIGRETKVSKERNFSKTTGNLEALKSSV